jgi:hypothetical protein
MRRVGLRLLAAAGVTAGTVPTVLVLLSVHVAAAPATFGQYSVTAVVRGSGTSGDVGASGGLTPLDSGSSSVDASLDNSPTAMVLARPLEPGTTFATVNSQLPTPVPVPEAQAAYPGPKGSDSVTPTPASAASAKVTASSALGTAETAGGASGGLSLGATSASASLSSTGDGGVVAGTADAHASGLDIAGVFVVHDVRGHAEIRATAGGKTTATASLVVGSASVAGQEVVIDDTGIHAVGTTVPLGPTLAQLTAAANGALAAAGISVSVAAPTHSTSTTEFGGHAAADSGGLRVTISTPDVGGGTVPANHATLTLGRVQLSESDAATGPGAAAPPPDSAPIAQTPAGAGVPGAPGVPGRVVTVPGSPGGISPAVAGAAPAGRTALVVAGHRVTSAAALAALGGWQALTLGAATFAVLALRRPVGGVGLAAGPDEEHLCPCPG